MNPRLLILSVLYEVALTFFRIYIPSHYSFNPTILGDPARLAYIISGSAGNGEMLKRTLLAVYHPHNAYIVCLDEDAAVAERLELFDYIGNHSVFSAVGNVLMTTVPAPKLSGNRGLTKVADYLYAASVLLEEAGDWDWLINLSATNYPLVTQDDLLYILSLMPRHLNFIKHDRRRLSKTEVIGQMMYMSKKEDSYSFIEARKLPVISELSTGSPSMALTRSFITYCIWWWENLPPTGLSHDIIGYSSMESYFHTVICHSQFLNTTVNADLHFVPQQQLRNLTIDDVTEMMMQSNAPFTREFGGNSGGDGSVLGWIDKHLLHRQPGRLVPGGWCAIMSRRAINAGVDPCLRVRNTTNFRPAHGAMRLLHLFLELVYSNRLQHPQCVGVHDLV